MCYFVSKDCENMQSDKRCINKLHNSPPNLLSACMYRLGLYTHRSKDNFADD